MSELQTLKQNAVGAVIDFIVREDGNVLDIGDATSITVRIKKRSGAVIEREAELATDGSDGTIRYATVEGDLDESGRYEAEAHFTLGGFTGGTTRRSFNVDEELEVS